MTWTQLPAAPPWLLDPCSLVLALWSLAKLRRPGQMWKKCQRFLPCQVIMTLKRGCDPRGSQRPKQLPRSSVLTVLQPCFYLRLYCCSLWLCSKINGFIWPIRYGIFGIGYLTAENWRAKPRIRVYLEYSSSFGKELSYKSKESHKFSHRNSWQ